LRLKLRGDETSAEGEGRDKTAMKRMLREDCGTPLLARAGGKLNQIGPVKGVGG